MKWHRSALRLGLTVIIACRSNATEATGPSNEQIFRDVRGSRISEQREKYERGTLLVAPLYLPMSEDRRMRAFVYLDLPAMLVGDSLDTIVYPTGTHATRVEYLAPKDAPIDAVPDAQWAVLDVRGLEVKTEHQVHFVLRPSGLGDGARLNGVSWLKEEQEQGTLALKTLTLRGAFEGPSARRQAYANKLTALNDCNTCHQANREENAQATVHRGTDAAGFFQVAAVFQDDGPLETYRPRDVNQEDPLMTLRCVSGEPPSHEPMPRCRDSIPYAAYNLRDGLARGAQHALQICKARIYLATRMTEHLRGWTAKALQPCL